MYLVGCVATKQGKVSLERRTLWNGTHFLHHKCQVLVTSQLQSHRSSDKKSWNLLLTIEIRKSQF